MLSESWSSISPQIFSNGLKKSGFKVGDEEQNVAVEESVGLTQTIQAFDTDNVDLKSVQQH